MKKNRSDMRTGATAVETAVVLPLLILLIIGTFDLLNAFIASKKVDLALYRAARTASIPGSTDAQIRQAALAEFATIKSQSVDSYLTLTVKRNLANVDVTAEISVKNAAYLQPLILKLGSITRNYVRDAEFSTDSAALDELNSKPESSTKGFNSKGKNK